jgi:hypothetical protein
VVIGNYQNSNKGDIVILKLMDTKRSFININDIRFVEEGGDGYVLIGWLSNRLNSRFRLDEVSINKLFSHLDKMKKKSDYGI